MFMNNQEIHHIVLASRMLEGHIIANKNKSAEDLIRDSAFSSALLVIQDAYDLLQSALIRQHRSVNESYDDWYVFIDEMKEEYGISHSIWNIGDVEDFNHVHLWTNVDYVKTEHSSMLIEVNGNTWGDLWIASDKAIAFCDNTHVYIEAYYKSLEHKNTLVISCGS
jgi:hypothetical protein